MSPATEHQHGTRRTRLGRALGIGWVITGVVITALVLALVGFLTRSASREPVSDGNQATGPSVVEDADTEDVEWVDYVDLAVGDCVRGMSEDDEDADLGPGIVSCDAPHTDEVFGTFTLPEGSWPGNKQVAKLAWRGCDNLFEGYVGLPVDDTVLDSYINPPVKIGWPQDRVVVCTVADSEEPHTGSLRNANR